MLAKLRSLKSKHLELESNLKEETKRPLADEFVVKQIKKKKLQIKDSIIKLIRTKSVRRRKRYHLRAKRLNRLGSLA